MESLFTTSPDGLRIAYDRCGTGPALVLLHGGGSSRQEWHQAGYVRRLQERYTVIPMDLRGHGESGLPTEPAEYTIEKLQADILTVADACGADCFALWGMSYGGKVGRYLGVHSERVARLVLLGTPLGPGVAGEERQAAIDFCAHWAPILPALQAGTLDFKALSLQDQELYTDLNIATMLGWVRAMLDWGMVEPADFRCPTLWLVGSEDHRALASVREYAAALPGSRVQLEILAGLNHEQVFDEVERSLPVLLAFMDA